MWRRDSLDLLGGKHVNRYHLVSISKPHLGLIYNLQSTCHVSWFLIVTCVSCRRAVEHGICLKQARQQNIRSAREIEMQIYHLFCDPKPTLVHHSRANVIVTHGLTLNSYSEGKKILCTFKIVNKETVVQALSERSVEVTHFKKHFTYLIHFCITNLAVSQIQYRLNTVHL